MPTPLPQYLMPQAGPIPMVMAGAPDTNFSAAPDVSPVPGMGVPPGASPLDSEQGVGQLLQQSDMTPGAPQTQEEQAHRAAGWQAFASKLQSDPAWQLALLSIGTNLMQPRPIGQTAAGQIGQSVAAGVQTYGAQKQIEYQHGVQQQELGLQGRRVSADEARVGLEGRRVAEGEKTGAVQRQSLEQQIQQNQERFPETLKLLKNQIAEVAQKTGMDKAQTEFLQVKAQQYPQQVRADLVRAQAALKAAGKTPALENIFATTAQAMVDNGEAKDLADAQSQLGQQYFNKARGAGAQNLAAFRQSILDQNPQEEGESNEDYQARIRPILAKETQNYLTTSKAKDYATAKASFLANSFDKEADGRLFDQLWVQSGKELPGGPGARADFKITDNINPSQLTKGKTYSIQLQDGSLKDFTFDGKKLVPAKK